MISEEELAALVEEIRPHVEAGAGEAEGAPTYFEVSVALALLHFVRARADLAVLEVGLGGRLDATNTINSDQVAELRVGYGGKGVVDETLKPGFISRLLNLIWPF